MTPSSSTVPSEPKTSTRIVVMLVELRCYLCANTVGVLETHHWPSFGPALLRTRPESPAVRIADWRRLRVRSAVATCTPMRSAPPGCTHLTPGWSPSSRVEDGRPNGS